MTINLVFILDDIKQCKLKRPYPTNQHSAGVAVIKTSENYNESMSRLQARSSTVSSSAQLNRELHAKYEIVHELTQRN
jgi:hypothetical protein